MKNSIFTWIFCLTATTLLSQNTGYFGKKTIVEFNMIGSTPVASNYLFGSEYSTVFYKEKNGSLVEKRDGFDFGIRLGAMRTLKRNFAIGFEAGTDYFSIGIPSYLDISTNDYSISLPVRHEMMDIRGLYFMPKIEFSNKGGLLPMGITQQIGFGFRYYSPVEKDYLYDVMPDYYGGQPAPVDIEGKVYNYKEESYKSKTVFYGIHMRTPINKFMFINYGVRYTVNFMKRLDQYNTYGTNVNEEYLINRAEMSNLIRARMQRSYIYASVGLSFVF